MSHFKVEHRTSGGPGHIIQPSNIERRTFEASPRALNTKSKVGRLSSTRGRLGSKVEGRTSGLEAAAIHISPHSIDAGQSATFSTQR